MIYLDSNATAPLRPLVIQAMTEALAATGNPSSVHRAGVTARRVVEGARRALAGFVGAAPHQVVFTASASEANALLLSSFPERPLLISAVEHASVRNTARAHAVIPVDENGLIRCDTLAALLEQHPRALVSVILAHNETGVLQNLPAIAALVRAHDGELHVDAAQSLGRMPLDFAGSHADHMTLCFHKCGGPVGVGALISSAPEALIPLIPGGAQEQRRRAGTESVPALAGVAALVADLEKTLFADIARYEQLRRSLIEELSEADVIALAAQRLPNTLCLAMPGALAETQVLHFDLCGIAVSAGSACSSGKVTVSSTLEAMNIEKSWQNSAIRVSFGWQTGQDDLYAFVQAWRDLHARTRRKQVA